MARDGEEFSVHAGGQDWIVSWHPPVFPPQDGTRHGSDALCFTIDGNVVLVSRDGESWEGPGGRPEGDEDWRETLDREVFEEACARVEEARLLGFTKSVCIKGHEEGLVLVRAHWWAMVALSEWAPQHEKNHRRLAPADAALDLMDTGDGHRQILQRLFHEASTL